MSDEEQPMVVAPDPVRRSPEERAEELAASGRPRMAAAVRRWALFTRAEFAARLNPLRGLTTVHDCTCGPSGPDATLYGVCRRCGGA